MSLLDKMEIETSRTSEKSWRGGGKASTGAAAAWPKHYWQDMYAHRVIFMLCIADHHSKDYQNQFYNASG